MPKRSNVFFLLALSTATAAMGATTYPQPLPASFSPASGPPGTVITVTGTGFTGLTQVWIGNAHDSNVYVISDRLVKVTVPADATTAHLGFINPQHSDFLPTNFTVTTGTAPSPTPTPGPAGGASSVSGSVAGPTSTAVMLTGKSTRAAGLNSAGSYRFADVTAGTYTVAPTVAGHVFTPTSVVAQVAAARRNRRLARAMLVLTLFCALGFAYTALRDWSLANFQVSSSAYGTLFYVLTGTHLAHVVAGAVLLFALTIFLNSPAFTRDHAAGVEAIAYYWHFVFVVWLALYATIYLVR